jgi:hypothetical protein
MREGILVTGWFDESGGKGTPASYVVGFAALPEQAVKIFGKWKERLQADGLQQFGMKEAIHFHDQFESWKEDRERRDTLLRDLATIIAGASMLKVSATVTSSEFNTLSEAEKRKFDNDPLYRSIHACIRSILDGNDRFTLHYTHDMTDKATVFMKYFIKLRKRDQIINNRCVGVTFVDDTCHHGIQMADMAAYCTRCVLDPQGSNDPVIPEVHAILTSKDQKKDKFLYISGELV